VAISFPTGNLRQLPQLNYTDRGHIATAIGNDRSLGEQEKAYVWNQIAAPLAMLPSMDDARAAIRKHEENEGGGIVRAILGFNTGDYNASVATVEAMRAYRTGGFAAFAQTWNRGFVQP
jgi:hypothetical protein